MTRIYCFNLPSKNWNWCYVLTLKQNSTLIRFFNIFTFMPWKLYEWFKRGAKNWLWVKACNFIISSLWKILTLMLFNKILFSILRTKFFHILIKYLSRNRIKPVVFGGIVWIFLFADLTLQLRQYIA